MMHVLYESLVCSEQLNWALFFKKNPLCPAKYSVFQHILHFEPFPAVTVWFWDPYFNTEDNWGPQTQLLKKVVVDHPGNHTLLRTKGSQTFECFFYIISAVFCLVLWININIFYVKYPIHDSIKYKITCILYDISYFVEITHIFTDSARSSQTFRQHCMLPLIWCLSWEVHGLILHVLVDVTDWPVDLSPIENVWPMMKRNDYGLMSSRYLVSRNIWTKQCACKTISILNSQMIKL